MKFSLSIGDTMYEQFAGLAQRVAGGNISLLAAVAFKELLQRDPAEVAGLVDLQRYDRQMPTRGAWMAAFWKALGHLTGQPDQDIFNSPYSPRFFGGFQVVLLMHNVGEPDAENDPFYPHVGPLPVMPGSPSPHTWTFPRSSTPIAVAEVVAARLREYGFTAPT